MQDKVRDLLEKMTIPGSKNIALQLMISGLPIA
jgi:hypothetical protein